MASNNWANVSDELMGAAGLVLYDILIQNSK